jgi:acyl-coenzyme A synthetase/AMP-(fatty) acid ligase
MSALPFPHVYGNIVMTANAAELIDCWRTRPAGYKVPRRVQFVADLPKTSTGTILRRELAQ